MLSNPDALRREIADALPDRPFAIRWWDGELTPATSEGGPTFEVRSPRALEQARDVKRERSCTKLALQAGERVLDVGCGWGAWAIHAASRHGVHVTGITLSPPQAAEAHKRADAAGVGDLCDFRVLDWRE